MRAEIVVLVVVVVAQQFRAAAARLNGLCHHRNLPFKLNDSPETSPFFELAGYHGWPGNGNERMYSYCEHRQETFPGWHRAYLVAFEKGLQEADRALGNDGQIALPYW